MLLGRPGWPAVQTEIVEALTFPGLLSISGCRWSGEPACASAWEMWQRADPAAREKSAWGPAGAGRWGGGEACGRQRAGEKGLPPAQWSPRGGLSEDNVPPGTRGFLRQAGGCAPAAS